MGSILKFCLLACFLSCFLSYVYADTIRLNNGRSITGIIKKEDSSHIELEVDSGMVKFFKSEISEINRSSSVEVALLRERWKVNRAKLGDKLDKQRMEEESKPRKAAFSHDAKGMSIGVRLNNKIDARMILDTGASLILLTRGIAGQLGVNLDKTAPDMKVQVADGRLVNAKRLVLDSVIVEDSEAKNVEAAVLMEEKGDFGFGDGLLGMSFLKNFNFKIDLKERKLILEKIR